MTHGPQKLPTSLSRIRSQTKQALREMAETTTWEANGNAVHKRISPHYATCICVCEGEDRHSNARLIAAAPELLQALQRYFTEDWSERYDEMESMFNSAIQSATGTAL